jgi:hypothetical protein
MTGNGSVGDAGGDFEEGKGGAGSAVGGTDSKNTMYRGYLQFERDTETFEKLLAELCPPAAHANRQPDQSSVNIVKDSKLSGIR